MLPVEVRIFPTVQVIADLNMFDSYSSLTLPLIASATVTFLFHQFFMSLLDERHASTAPARYASSGISCCRRRKPT